MVVRRCRAMLGDEQDAQEASQDVFVRVLKNANRLDDKAPSALLYRVATNVCLNKIRSRGRRPEIPLGDRLLQIAGGKDSAARSQARQWLDRLFDRHPESTRTIAVLYWVDGYTYAQIAEIVGLSVSGVRKRLRRLQGMAKDWEARDV